MTVFKSVLGVIFSFFKKPVVIFSVVIVVLGGFAVFVFLEYQQTKSEFERFRSDPRALVAEQNNQLIDEIGKLVELPTTEEPTIATITDVDRLKDQAFFTKAENDDKILIYTDAKRAILYRPSTNKIIEVAPVNIGQDDLAQAAETEQQTYDVVLYNGTVTTGVNEEVEAVISSSSNSYSIRNKTNASQTHLQSLVIDLTGNNNAAATDLAAIIGATVSELPEGESVPENAELLVIVGADLE